MHQIDPEYQFVTKTLAKLSKNQPVSMEVLLKICEKFDCNIGDIVDCKKEDAD